MGGPWPPTYNSHPGNSNPGSKYAGTNHTRLGGNNRKHNSVGYMLTTCSCKKPTSTQDAVVNSLQEEVSNPNASGETT
jgi:hypothetical protein